MNGKDLISGLSFVDENFVNEAEMKKLSKTNKIKWQKISAIAACFVLVVFSSVLLLNNTDNSIKNPDDLIIEAPNHKDKLNFNHATGNIMAKRIYIKGHFWQALSEKEMKGIFHKAADDYDITATANFSKTENAITLYDINATVKTNENLTATVTVSQNKIEKCYVLEGEPVLSKMHNILINAGYFDKTNDGKTTYYADFQVDDVYYYIEMVGGNAEKEALSVLIDTIISGGKANFAIITPITPEQLREDKLTLEEAYQDKDFGRFIPHKFSSGYSLNSAYRFINQASDYLMISMSNGMHDISWNISFVQEDNKKRLTSVADTQNYNLALYPIPHADSVPPNLSEIVDNPIFTIEDLTLEAVKMRSYTLNDSGDIDGERMRFSVLYGDVLVEVSTKGVASTKLYEMLTSLK